MAGLFGFYFCFDELLTNISFFFMTLPEYKKKTLLHLSYCHLIMETNHIPGINDNKAMRINFQRKDSAKILNDHKTDVLMKNKIALH